jgi:Glyceraldehyde-3-phosphate dehydrogenase/erythrose-4-phosphate dehydrogenase
MTETPTTYEEICEVVKKASENEMKGILEYVDDEVVSSDFLGDPHTSIFDAREGITLNNQLFKIILYYDNEFGYATKTLELAKYMNAIDNK